MKSNILLIMAQKGFLYEGSKFEGYVVLHPYKEANLCQRLCREFVIRFVPFIEFFFYNREIYNGNYDKIIVWDPLITKRFLFRLKSEYPNAQINYIYWNMVGKCNHLQPNNIPDYVRKWTYDNYDSNKYNLRLYTTYPYYRKYIRIHKSNEIDVLFIGKDKGRGEFLLDLERRMNAIGLKTKFIITKTSRFSRNKSFYSPEISYEEVCDLISRSRSVLNVIMDNQEGITLRDLEYVFQGVKLLTTNTKICTHPIFNPNNVFVIKDKYIEGLDVFLKTPMEPINDNLKEHHSFDSFIREITE